MLVEFIHVLQLPFRDPSLQQARQLLFGAEHSVAFQSRVLLRGVAFLAIFGSEHWFYPVPTQDFRETEEVHLACLVAAAEHVEPCAYAL